MRGQSGVSWDDGGRDGFSRAYLHHLDRCGEMLGPMLTTIHNLHYYLNLMQEIRDALDAGTFTEFRARFKADRARGVEAAACKGARPALGYAPGVADGQTARSPSDHDTPVSKRAFSSSAACSSSVRNISMAAAMA